MRCGLYDVRFKKSHKATKPLDSFIPLRAGTSPLNWLSIVLSKRSHNLLPPYSSG